MFWKTKGTRLVKLCVTDDLYTETGHPLTRTQYDYDQDGKITHTTREYQYSKSATRTMGVPTRRITWDEYQILRSEELFRQDGTVVTFPHILLYEKDESGLIRCVVEAVGGRDDEPYFPIHYYIGYHPSWPHRRGLVTRARHLFQDGTFCYEYRYEYNEHGHNTRTYRYCVEGDPEKRKRLIANKIYAYDEHGNLTLYNNGREYAFANKYDKEGNLRAAVVTERNKETGKWELVGRHEYSYEAFKVAVPAQEPT